MSRITKPSLLATPANIASPPDSDPSINRHVRRFGDLRPLAGLAASKVANSSGVPMRASDPNLVKSSTMSSFERRVDHAVELADDRSRRARGRHDPVSRVATKPGTPASTMSRNVGSGRCRLAVVTPSARSCPSRISGNRTTGALEHEVDLPPQERADRFRAAPM